MTITSNQITRGWRGDVAAFVIGLPLPLAFAPFNIVPLVFILPAAFFWLCTRAPSDKRGLWRGFLFGLGFYGVGVSWISVSMYRFGGIAIPLATLLMLLFVAAVSCFPALYGYCFRRFFRNTSVYLQMLVVVPALWVLTEWPRTWVLSGFPWLTLGYSQTDGPLYGWAPIVGVYGVSLGIALCSGLLVLVVIETGRRRWILAGTLASFIVVSMLLGQIQWGSPSGEPVRGSVIQGNVAQELKWRREYRQHSIDLYTKHTRQNWQSDIIIWPETALPSLYRHARTLLEGLGAEARSNNTTLLIGLATRDSGPEKRYYNSLVSVGDSSEPTFYRKNHLVPFGEFVPLRWLLGGLLDFFDIPMANFAEGGAGQPLLQAAGHKIGVSICYEDVFGDEVILGLPEAEILVNVSNDAWFGDSLAPHQHQQIARMRTIETARPMFRATNNGVSAIIDHRGKILGVSPQFKEYVLTGEVQPMTGTTPYVVLGNTFVVVLSSLMLVVVVVINRKIAS